MSGLPDDLPAAVCIVLHISPGSPSALAHILQRAGPLPCRPAVDGEPLRPHEILVAPPDRHLVIENRHVRLTAGPTENGHRPAINVLFRSAATSLNSRVIGVILTGTRDDGTAGLALIKANGGATIVQDPGEALYPGMPANAIAHVKVDAVVPSQLVAGTIAAMVKGERPPPHVRASDPQDDPDETGKVSAIRPECGGVLNEHTEAGATQWECGVSHRYSPESLADAQADDVEAALWAAIRTLEDRGALLERMADQAQARGQQRSARSFPPRAQTARKQATLVREALAHAGARPLHKVGDGRDEAEQECAA